MSDPEKNKQDSLSTSNSSDPTGTALTSASAPEKKEDSQWACSHYKRNCLLKAKCCGKFYPCRFCHDDTSTHEMDRHKVEQIQCIKCHATQDVSQKCCSCAVLFGEYFCRVCRLFDTNNQQFHCDKCGICRVGPREKFYHCDTCNACLSKELEGNHKCLDNISMSPCPICQELLHTSRLGMHIPKCGHMIHQHYQCPLCKESLEDMSEVWSQMDRAVAETRMPEELVNLTVAILCQDCHQQCSQKFNTEGLKCTGCGSYNTVRV